METTLYDIPKDMLVKLICTIRDDINNEWTKKYKDLEIRYNLMRQVSINSRNPIYIESCSFPGCQSLMCSNDRDTDFYHNCDDMRYCDGCETLFCNKHREGYFCGSCRLIDMNEFIDEITLALSEFKYNTDFSYENAAISFCPRNKDMTIIKPNGEVIYNYYSNNNYFINS